MRSTALSAAAQEGPGVDKDEEGKEGPDEEAECDGGLGRAAECVTGAPWGAPPCSEGDGTSEPKDHSDPLNGQSRDTVEEAGEVEGCQE